MIYRSLFGSTFNIRPNLGGNQIQKLKNKLKYAKAEQYEKLLSKNILIELIIKN